jgi:type VI secretion system secreted protein Hcp
LANGPFEIFLKLDGIEGESTVKGHEKEIVVLSYEQSVAHPVLHELGGGAGQAAGPPHFSGVRFRKYLDKGSIPLLLAGAAGTRIREAVFTFRRTATGVEFYKVKLKDVLVTRILQVAGTTTQYPLSFDALNAGADTHGVLDEVTLEYGKIEWEYHPVDPTGKPKGTAVKGGWDLRTNRRV